MVMVGPYMSLTVEEQKLLSKLVSDTQVLHIIYIYLHYLHKYIYNTYIDISTTSTQISTAQAVVRRCWP